MEELVKYKILKVDHETGEEFTGLDEIAFTSDPAIITKGLAFSAVKRMHFNDKPKMRIVAPAMIPMDIYRNQDGEEFEVTFTAEQIEEIHKELMLKTKDGNLFNFEHDKSSKVPAYILEAWIVDNPKEDKAWSSYGIDVPKGTLMLTTQITDEKFYNELVKNDQIGYSIGGSFGLKLSKNQSYSDVVVFNSDGRLLLLKRTDNDTFEPSKYGFVGGKIENGESPDLAAKREMFEESGIETDISFLTKFKNQDGSITHYFTCVYDGEVKLSKEHHSFNFFELSEIEKLDVILGQNERFKEIATNAKKTLKLSKQTNTNNMSLPAENLTEGKQYIFRNGKLEEVDVKFSEETTDEKADEVVEEVKEEMASEEATEEVKEEVTEEVSTELAEEQAPVDVLTEEKVSQMIDAKVGEVLNMLAELKATIEEAKNEDIEEEEEQAPVQLSAIEKLAKFSKQLKNK